MKIVSILAGLALFAALAALALSFTPQTLPGLPGPPLAAPLPRALPPPEVSLSALPTGSMHSLGAFAWRGGSWRHAIDFGMTGYLIHHPRGDLLVDTGFGREVDAHAKRLPLLMQLTTTYRKGTPIAAQFDAAGYDYRQLAGIVLTHAHWDHISGIPDLPGIPVWVDADERAFIDSGASMSGLARSLGGLPYHVYDFAGGAYFNFERSDDVWGDGSVVLVPAPGHTPGSVIVFVNLPSGARYALLGDLVWQRQGIELPAERPWIARQLVDEDSAQVRENIERVAAIHRRYPEIHLVPAHDAAAAAEIPTFPAAAH